MSKSIFVVMRQTGSYEDYRNDPVCACTSRDKADKLVDLMQESANKVVEQLRILMEAYNAVEPENMHDAETPESQAAWDAYDKEEKKHGTNYDRKWIREMDPPYYYTCKLQIRESAPPSEHAENEGNKGD